MAIIKTTIPTETVRKSKSDTTITSSLSQITVDGKSYYIHDSDLDDVISNLNTLASQVKDLNDGICSAFDESGEVSVTSITTSGDSTIGGNETVTGTVTASSFSGDGSAVTNVNASTVNGKTVGSDVPENAVILTTSNAYATSDSAGLVKLSTTSSTQSDDAVLSSKATHSAIDEAVSDAVQSVYKFIGSVNGYSELEKITKTNYFKLENNSISVSDSEAEEYKQVQTGYVFNNLIDNMNYAWNGEEWDPLGNNNISDAIDSDSSTNYASSKAVKTAYDLANSKVSSSSTTSTNLNVAVYDGTTGKIIKDSGYTIASSVPSDANFENTGHIASVNGSALVLTSVSGSTSGSST